MKYLKRRLPRHIRNTRYEDPLSGLANLLDLALVFIVALFLAFMAAYKMLDFFNEESEITIMKKDEKQQWNIITKKGKKVKVQKVTDKKVGGDEGLKLGTAYQLKNGQMIYIPEETSKTND